MSHEKRRCSQCRELLSSLDKDGLCAYHTMVLRGRNAPVVAPSGAGRAGRALSAGPASFSEAIERAEGLVAELKAGLPHD